MRAVLIFVASIGFLASTTALVFFVAYARLTPPESVLGHFAVFATAVIALTVGYRRDWYRAVSLLAILGLVFVALSWFSGAYPAGGVAMLAFGALWITDAMTLQKPNKSPGSVTPRATESKSK